MPQGFNRCVGVEIINVPSDGAIGLHPPTMDENGNLLPRVIAQFVCELPIYYREDGPDPIPNQGSIDAPGIGMLYETLGEKWTWDCELSKVRISRSGLDLGPALLYVIYYA